MRLSSLVLLLALGAAFAARSARADDKPGAQASPPAKTPEQVKAEQKDKDFKKAKEDLEKELNGKKQDPAPAVALLNYLAYSVALEVKESNELVHKVLAKKIPIATDAMSALGEKQQKATDPKTNKLDVKKMVTEFKKWIDAWKPPAPAPSPSPAAGGK